MAEEDEDGAARAFESLRAEVTVMRRAVESLEAKKLKDYAPSLGEISRRLDGVEQVVAVLANRPAIKLTPEAYEAQMRRAKVDAARPVESELQRAQNLTAQLDRALGAIRPREAQRRQVLYAAAGGVAGGVVVLFLLLPVLARGLPDSWHVAERWAASVVGTDRWNAGQQIAASASPEVWARTVQAARLEEANRETLDACTADAAKTGRRQRCTIQVDPPTRPSPVPGEGGLAR